jgi:hypothetical protein
MGVDSGNAYDYDSSNSSSGNSYTDDYPDSNIRTDYKNIDKMSVFDDDMMESNISWLEILTFHLLLWIAVLTIWLCWRWRMWSNKKHSTQSPCQIV